LPVRPQLGFPGDEDRWEAQSAVAQVPSEAAVFLVRRERGWIARKRRPVNALGRQAGHAAMKPLLKGRAYIILRPWPAPWAACEPGSVQ